MLKDADAYKFALDALNEMGLTNVLGVALPDTRISLAAAVCRVGAAAGRAAARARSTPCAAGGHRAACLCLQPRSHAGPQAAAGAQRRTRGIAASQVVPATIIGRTAHAANNAAVAEDRTCTLERLQHFLESKRPRIFLFSGHADLEAEGRPKTLGFTTPDGKFAPLQEPAEIARLLGYACSTDHPNCD